MNRTKPADLIPLFEPEALREHTVDATPEQMKEWTKGVPEIILGLKGATPRSPEDYRKLELADVLTDGYVARVLNENGYASSTVCPGCHVDDFTHVEGCKVGYREQKS